MKKANEDITSPADQAAGDWQFDPTGDVEIVIKIRADQLFALELLENELRHQGHDEELRSMLVREALDLLIERDIKVVRLPGNKMLAG